MNFMESGVLWVYAQWNDTSYSMVLSFLFGTHNTHYTLMSEGSRLPLLMMIHH